MNWMFIRRRWHEKRAAAWDQRYLEALGRLASNDRFGPLDQRDRGLWEARKMAADGFRRYHRLMAG
jgi:hypothetical protein